MGLADIFGNLQNSTGAIGEALQKATQGIPQAGSVIQDTIQNTVNGVETPTILQGEISKQVNMPTPENNTQWQDEIMRATKDYANSQFTPQQFRISSLPQMQYAPNKQFAGLSGLLKQARGY